MLPLWDDEPHRRTPVITALLIAVNVAVFGYQAFLALQDRRGLDLFLDAYALIPRDLIRQPGSGAEWLTVFSSMFLHGGVFHLVGNCWFLWVFGNNIEDRLGPFRYLLFYLVCGVSAAGAQVLAYPEGSIPMIGASGAISGVLGAYLVLFPFALIYTLVPWIVPILPIPAIFFLVIWFGVQAMKGVGSLMSGEIAGGGVAWWAHAGGFLAGFLMIAYARRKKWVKRRP